MSRKLEEKKARRLAEEKRRAEKQRRARRSNLVTIVVAIVVIGVVVLLIVRERSGGSGPIGVPAAEARCEPVERHEIEGSDHVAEGQPVQYRTSPPTSGDHAESPADDGFYSAPVAAERLVHNLEHGQIVIWYRPDASGEVVDGLERYIDDTKQPFALIAVPYDGLAGDVDYAMTAWGVSRGCELMSGDAIDNFRSRFQGRGPEQRTPPF